jgi:DNA polymerase III alpha subunit (gram-positive type)
LAEFSRFVGDATLVAHNGHRFDMKFLAAGCQQARLETRTVPYHDSLGLSWLLWGRQGCRHGLDAVLSRLDLSDASVRRHDARGDVELLSRAIELMTRQLEESGKPVNLKRYEGALPRIA